MESDFPKTPPIPEIIHSTLAVFKEPVERTKVQAILDKHPIKNVEYVTDFRLVKETKMRMQEFEVVKTYPLTP